MRMKVAAGIMGLCTLSQGCGSITLATRTLVIEPSHYCMTLDNIMELHRDHKLAKVAWKDIEKAAKRGQAGSPHEANGGAPDPSPLPSSPDYAKGFQDGFADHLYRGGTGEPPPLPPRYYWRMRYETPEGHRAIEDWFSGFRHGAAVAQQSGYRQWVAIRSSLPPQQTPSLQPAPIVPENTAVPPSEPVLPAPRKLPAPQDPAKHGGDGGGPANPSPYSPPSNGVQDGGATTRESGDRPAVATLCSWLAGDAPQPSSIVPENTDVRASDVILLPPRPGLATLCSWPAGEAPQPSSIVAENTDVRASDVILLPPRKIPPPQDPDYERLYVNCPAAPPSSVSLPR